MWSVHGRVVRSAALVVVHGCVSRLLGGLFAVGTFVPQPAPGQPGVVRVRVSQMYCLGFGWLCRGQPMFDPSRCVVSCGGWPSRQPVVSWLYITKGRVRAAGCVELSRSRLSCGRSAGQGVRWAAKVVCGACCVSLLLLFPPAVCVLEVVMLWLACGPCVLGWVHCVVAGALPRLFRCCTVAFAA